MVTFTNKAARELKERLSALVGVEVTRRLIVGTFHSISLRYLQRYGISIGLGTKIAVADASESRNVISKVLKSIRKQIAEKPILGETDAAVEKAQNASSFLAHISKLKGKGITAKMLPSMLNSASFPLMMAQASREELLLVYESYQEHLTKHNLLDFDDLIVKAIELFRSCKEVVQNIEQVFVDEYQDTSSQQYDLMRYLAQSRGNLTIVGDHDQSIYGFRSADIANFKRMQESYPHCVEVHLKQNYRSSGAIVFAASALIEQDVARPLKRLETQNGLGPQPTLRTLQNAKNEAEWLAKEVKRLLDSTGDLLRTEDFAILVRSASLTLPIEQALQRSQIKYRLTNARKFLERPHIRTLVSYLRVLHDENSLALLEVVNIPPRKFGQTSIDNLQSESSRIRKNLWDTLRLVSKGSITLSRKRDSNVERRLCALVKLVEQCRSAVIQDSTISMAELIAMLINGLQYETYLKSQYPEDYTDRIEDVREFMQTSDVLAEETHDGDLPEVDGVVSSELCQTSLDRLMSALSLMSDTGSSDSNASPGLTISTIHSAKGLEWPVVFIPGVYHGSIPSARAMDSEQDEERRLLYVAMTRAKALLYMSYPLKNARHESVHLSSFLLHSSMVYLVDARGPKINPHMIKELSTILQRDAPESGTIKITEDMYEDRTAEQLADDDYDLVFINNKFVKRKREEIPKEAEAGFSSASKVLKAMGPEQVMHRSKPPSLLKKSSTQQKSIKAFFAPAASLTRQSSLSEIRRDPSVAKQCSFDDYRTVILSSSPEREMPTSRPGFTNPQGEHSSVRMRYQNFPTSDYTTTQTLPKPIMNPSADLTKPKKRLGMSRPRIPK